MHLSARQAEVLGRVMATLAEPLAEPEIRGRLGTLMLDLLGAQHYASYVWDEGRQRFDAGVHLNMDAANLLRYEQHYQYHDPITLTLQQHRRAVRDNIGFGRAQGGGASDLEAIAVDFTDEQVENVANFQAYGFLPEPRSSRRCVAASATRPMVAASPSSRR